MRTLACAVSVCLVAIVVLAQSPATPQRKPAGPAQCPPALLETQPRWNPQVNAGTVAPASNPSGTTVETDGGRSPAAIGPAPAQVVEQMTPTAETPVNNREMPNQPQVLPAWGVQGTLAEASAACQPAAQSSASPASAARNQQPAASTPKATARNNKRGSAAKR